jgi:anaerobic magnesium-protoporphyrin IX monomethyl ester cyclase
MKVGLLFPSTPFNVDMLPEMVTLSSLYGKFASEVAQEKLENAGIKLKTSPADGYRVILGLLIAASILKKEGHNVSYFQEDYMLDNNYDSLFKDLAESDCVFIAFSTAQYNRVVEIIRKIKIINPNIIVTLMGREPTFIDETVLSDTDCDIAIRGDGEETIKNICDIIEKSKRIEHEKLKKCNGITFKNRGNIVRTKDAKQINLDSLPSPDFGLLQRDFVKKANVTLATTRGCGFHCAYCYESSFWGCKTRFRSVDKVIEDLKLYFEHFPFNHVFFHDSTFTIDKKRTIKLSKTMRKEFGDNFYFGCNARGETLDDKLLKIMQQSGCTHMFMGIDSFDERVLKRSNRMGSLSRNLNAIHLVNKRIPLVVCSTIIGLPGETYETAVRTIEESKKLIRDGTFQVTSRLFVPYPGTPIFSNPKKYDIEIISKDFSRYDRYSYPPVIRLPDLNEFELYGLLSSFFGMATVEMAKRKGVDINSIVKGSVDNIKSQNPYKTVYYSEK